MEGYSLNKQSLKLKLPGVTVNYPFVVALCSCVTFRRIGFLSSGGEKQPSQISPGPLIWLLGNLKSGRVRSVATHLLKLKRSLSKTSTGPVLLRMVRGWPASRQNTAPVSAVPRKLSSTPCNTHTHKTNVELTHMLRLWWSTFIVTSSHVYP